MSKALIFYGGWEGHEPAAMAAIIQRELGAQSFEVQAENSLEPLDDAVRLREFDLIVPCWTMGELSEERTKNLADAVASGVGLGGFHGGMGDAFRGNLTYEWMTGGHFLGHPHVGDYRIRLTDRQHPITDALPQDFIYNSEQYYMMVDPAIEVLADTLYEQEGRRITMPVIWTHQWGRGRVFYSALGHQAKEFTDYPAVLEMTLKGLIWAARD